jgi:hypothetical protein
MATSANRRKSCGMESAAHAERQAAVLFVGTALVGAIAVGSMIVADWSGGRLDNRIEPLFWAGAILGAAGIALLGLAAVPGRPGRRGILGLIRVGVALFLISPVLCTVAVFGDYWI